MEYPNDHTNEQLPNLAKFNLYIDHQQLAPLIRLLQDTVQQAENQTNNQFSRFDLRDTIYQEFVTIINTMYAERFQEIKLEDQLPTLPPEEDIRQRLLLRPRQQKQINRDPDVEENRQPLIRNTAKTRSIYSLQVEIELIQWIISCNKNTFDHKQIVQKYCELSKGTKKRLTIENIMNLLQKYKLKHIIVRGKQGKQHFFKQEVNQPSIEVKQEEFSRIVTVNKTLPEQSEIVKKDEQQNSRSNSKTNAQTQQEEGRCMQEGGGEQVSKQQ